MDAASKRGNVTGNGGLGRDNKHTALLTRQYDERPGLRTLSLGAT